MIARVPIIINAANFSTKVVCATRGAIDFRVCASWMALEDPEGFPRSWLFAGGAVPLEQKLTDAIDVALRQNFKFILTVDDDALPPPSAHLHLLNSIGNYDAIAGLAFKKELGPKGERFPVFWSPAWGTSPAPTTAKPGDLRNFHGIQESTIVGTHFTLWRTSIFRDVPKPWFTPTIDPVTRRYIVAEDEFFCTKARAHGKRVAVDFSLSVGHLDTKTGQVF